MKRKYIHSLVACLCLFPGIEVALANTTENETPLTEQTTTINKENSSQTNKTNITTEEVKEVTVPTSDITSPITKEEPAQKTQQKETKKEEPLIIDWGEYHYKGIAKEQVDFFKKTNVDLPLVMKERASYQTQSLEKIQKEWGKTKKNVEEAKTKEDFFRLVFLEVELMNKLDKKNNTYTETTKILENYLIFSSKEEKWHFVLALVDILVYEDNIKEHKEYGKIADPLIDMIWAELEKNEPFKLTVLDKYWSLQNLKTPIHTLPSDVNFFEEKEKKVEAKPLPLPDSFPIQWTKEETGSFHYDDSCYPSLYGVRKNIDKNTNYQLCQTKVPISIVSSDTKAAMNPFGYALKELRNTSTGNKNNGASANMFVSRSAFAEDKKETQHEVLLTLVKKDKKQEVIGTNVFLYSDKKIKPKQKQQLLTLLSEKMNGNQLQETERSLYLIDGKLYLEEKQTETTYESFEKKWNKKNKYVFSLQETIEK